MFKQLFGETLRRTNNRQNVVRNFNLIITVNYLLWGSRTKCMAEKLKTGAFLELLRFWLTKQSSQLIYWSRDLTTIRTNGL